ncbi:hypothetical protein KM295_15860 [Natronomonas sp. F2-12]|uniref:Uncharacterized protein n=1 Tax=Natronomonas aquatica TaxID=2841590 RepID=A0A9R1D7J0_9EURY|nr:hypothetical protein [Natronomonas aquatica]MCQ4334927.1 hypothetical protein [Natronomonas aquatica]
MSQKHLDREKSLGLTPAEVPLKALPTVKLSREDIRRALDLAEKRNDSAIDEGVVFGDQTALSSHQTGLLGELAVARLYGLNVDENAYKQGDDGIDLSLHGTSIDVKSTATRQMSRPDLLVRANKPLKSELYIRTHVFDCTASRARIRIIGCASKEKVKDQMPEPYPEDTLNRVVRADEMDFLPLISPADC